MCAIAGIISKNKKISDFEIRNLKKILNHRGPDASGYFSNEEVMLLHNRLSIIDLKNGNQPMEHNSRDICITYNGEIYDFIKSREEYDYKFITECDTENLIAGYEKYGFDLPLKLKGMFAFAIWDDDNQTLFCARDRLGEKPFFIL